jgi:hypothetical protein
MFNLSTQNVVQSIKKAPLVNLDGLLYQEYDEFFGKDYKFTIPENSDFKKLEYQEHLPRVVLSKKTKLSKQLSIFFMHRKITEALESKFDMRLRFASVDMWIDGKGYTQSPHVDDKRVKLHVHVYLNDNNVGTSLFNEKGLKIHTFEFRANKGYALLNNSKSFHGLDVVKQDGRTSLYARYS